MRGVDRRGAVERRRERNGAWPMEEGDLIDEEGGEEGVRMGRGVWVDPLVALVSARD